MVDSPWSQPSRYVLQFADVDDLSQHLDSLGRELRRGEKQRDGELFVWLRRLYQIGGSLIEDASLWDMLLSDPFWEKAREKPSREDQPNAFHFALKRALGMSKRASSKISKWKPALVLLYSEKVPADDFENHIRNRNGLAGLRREYSELENLNGASLRATGNATRARGRPQKPREAGFMVNFAPTVKATLLSAEEGSEFVCRFKITEATAARIVIEMIRLKLILPEAKSKLASGKLS